jgi:hypothetical protein
MSDDPFAKFAPAKPAAGGGGDDPFAKFAPVAAPEEPGILQRLWDGLSGKDVSRAGRFGMGLGDPLYGAAQLGAHGNFGLPLTAVGPPGQAARMQETMGGVAQAADDVVQQREARYKGAEQAEGLSGGLGTEWARLLGNVASPVNLAIGGAAGAGVRGLPLAARLGTYAVGGAASGLTSPESEEGAFEPGALAARGALGAAGGAVWGAAGEAVGSLLSRAIAGNVPRLAYQALIEAYRSVVKPSRVGRGTAPRLAAQDQQIIDAVDMIVANQPALQLTMPNGVVAHGGLPRTLRQFSEALDQIKGAAFRQYDDMQRQAGAQGARVDLAPVVTRLNAIARSPEVVDLHPDLGGYATNLAQSMLGRRFYTPSEAQSVIQNINRTLDGFYQNPTHESVSRAAIIAPVAEELRAGLDTAISNTPAGPGYQLLKTAYGSARSVEKDVTAAVNREANKMGGGGLTGGLLNLASGSEVLRGIFHLSPEAVATGVGLKAVQAWHRRANDPNAAITRLFRGRAGPQGGRAALGPPIQGAATGAGVVAGGEGGETAERLLRPSVAGP